MRKTKQIEQEQTSEARFPANAVLLTPSETAAALNVCLRTLNYWTSGRRPRLPYVKLGKSKRFVAADVQRFIEEHKIAA